MRRIAPPVVLRRPGSRRIARGAIGGYLRACRLKLLVDFVARSCVNVFVRVGEVHPAGTTTLGRRNPNFGYHRRQRDCRRPNIGSSAPWAGVLCCRAVAGNIETAENKTDGHDVSSGRLALRCPLGRKFRLPRCYLRHLRRKLHRACRYEQ
jgi:hypothetical protein